MPGNRVAEGTTVGLQCGYMTQFFLQDIIIFCFLFLHNFTASCPSSQEPALSVGVVFIRAIIKGSCLVSVATAHSRGGLCARMLRVATETGATAYISIQCASVAPGTFLRIINAQSVCSLLSKITTMSFLVAGGITRRTCATVKVGLISSPIKPRVCMKQLSTAISKVTHQIILFTIQ